MSVANLPLVDAKIPFDAPVQSGIEQPSQAHLSVLAFNLKDGVDSQELQELLMMWTQRARSLTQGGVIEGFQEREMVEAIAHLTITAGFGERIFDVLGKQDLKPEGLHAIPAFATDYLDAKWGQSDLVLQVCCDDLVTLATACRMMIKVAQPYARIMWQQRGFAHAYGAAEFGATPRNPMGSLDGTVNPKSPEEYAEQVWISSDASYLNNSTIMVIRRIAINLDAWGEVGADERNRVIGRDLHTGAPLSGGDDEFVEEDMDAVDSDGNYLIDRNSHLALSREQDDLPNDALRRRAYAYDEPLESDAMTANAGLVWIAFQKNPDKQFTAIQKRLAKSDLLNEYIRHIGSAVYWIVPGTTEDTYWGQGLLEA